MNAVTKVEAAKPTGLDLLRAPFPPNQISKLPKETRAQIDQRKADKSWMLWNCPVCNGHHHKNAVHLDYVGHAALTNRLLDCDPSWDWEPLATDERGLPAFDQNGCLWIKLTVCGVTRIGVGDADGKIGGNARKEAIGDALRNAAMRFGAALDLWHKGDLHDVEETPEGGENDADAHTPEVVAAPTLVDDGQWSELIALIEATSTDAGKFCKAFKVESVKALHADAFPKAKAMLERKLATMGETVDA